MYTDDEINRLVQQVVARMDPQEMIVFGSYAKGTATSKSDLDLFVIKETNVPMVNRAAALAPILAHQLIPVDVHVYTPEEVAEYSRDPLSFVSSILKSGKTVFRNRSVDV
jgi:predicted nucleotidyltransferase